MNLRDYQDGAVEGTMNVFRNGARSALIVLPTGLGKTVVFSEVVRRFQPGRAMVLAHREELIFQARDKIARFAGIDAQVEMGSYKVEGWFGKLPPCVVSTVQTQTAGGDGGGRMTKFDPKDFELVVIDEAHHATSSTYRRCIDWYRQNPDCCILGVTATPDRADEAALGQVFDQVAYSYEILDAIRNGWLVSIKQQMVTVGTLDFSKCRTVGNDLNQGDLAAVMEMEKNLHGVAVPTVEICGEKRAIVFATTVEQAEKLCEIINRYKPNKAAWICGKTDKEVRRDILAKFKRGEVQFVVNVGVLTEGFDDAGVEVVVMARPTKSRALYAQMAGRGTRPDDEIAGRLGECATAEERVEMIRTSAKPSCLIVDFCGNSGRHKLVSTADILGGNIDDAAIELAVRKMRENGGPMDVTAEIEAARKEVEKRKRDEAAKRASLQAKAEYMVSRIDPFNVWDLKPVKERGWDRHRHFSEKQGQILLEKIGVDPEKIPYGQGKQLLDEYFRRISAGYASLKQTNLLRRHGFVAPIRREEAQRMIGRIADRQGWHR